MSSVQIEEWDDLSSNKEQQYSTHGAFRYFGKLPPTITGRILDELSIGPANTIVDLMCGSGTTLVEAMLRGATAIGVDCNDISALIAKVKTTALDTYAAARQLNNFDRRFSDFLSYARLDEIPETLLRGLRAATDEIELKTRNPDHWFDPRTRVVLSAIRLWVDGIAQGPIKDMCAVAFVSSIRSCSSASVRTGRLFKDREKVLPNPVYEVRKRIEKISAAAVSLKPGQNSCRIIVSDARSTPLETSSADLIFCHPPYFALYKYSSDILRLEMDWLGVDRKPVSKREIEDGFKTTNERLVSNYVEDLVAVAKEARRLGKEDSRLVFVTADSTLRNEPLSVMNPLIAGTEREGWKLERRARRKVRFAQASYHRSADHRIVRPDDEVVIFSAV